MLCNDLLKYANKNIQRAFTTFMTMKSIAVIFQTTLILIFLSVHMYDETQK